MNPIWIMPGSGDADPESGKPLGHRAARGASVMMVGQIGRILVQTASVAILARLLDPVDYGLIAIVLAIMGVGEILRDFGLSTGAIQAERLSVLQRDKLVWLNTAIGAGLTVIAAATAPLVAAVFDQPQLTGIMIALSVTFLVNGISAQYRADLNRRMKFRAMVVADVGAQVFGIVVAVAMAVAGAAYWALVAQQLSLVAGTLVILMAYARWLARTTAAGRRRAVHRPLRSRHGGLPAGRDT